jgi:hypothetical protein
MNECLSGTRPSGQRGELACRRSQVRIPAVAVSRLREVAVRERPLWSAVLPGHHTRSQRLEPPSRVGEALYKIIPKFFFNFMNERMNEWMIAQSMNHHHHH